ncbi:MAG: DUF559 domain-containing protein [Candidatus Pacebacteria bacterium]|nr:DUF559 domain-containing protein [Candidatus Paceibacterota bacterium]
MNAKHKKNLLILKNDIKRKNAIRDRFKKIRVQSITPAQSVLFNALGLLAEEYAFKVVKEREIYTKEGVRFADLFIKKYGLIIEVDGGYHFTSKQIEEDKRRDEEIWSKKMIITLRFKNENVMSDMDGVLTSIRSMIARLSALYRTKCSKTVKMNGVFSLIISMQISDFMIIYLYNLIKVAETPNFY